MSGIAGGSEVFPAGVDGLVKKQDCPVCKNRFSHVTAHMLILLIAFASS